MVNNNLYKVENTLRSIAKRYKSVKYSLGLAILFLMMGVSAFSEEVVAQEAVAQQEVMTTEQIASSKENLRNSVGSLQSKIDAARAENEKGLAGLRLELIQLMEQGDQVVKSPWASWQFGANYMYSKWNGAYKGRGDKSEKYPFEGTFSRSTNVFGRVATARTADQKATLNSIIATNGGFNPNGNGLNYGLISRAAVLEDPMSIEVSAGIRPKNIQKGAITLNVPPVNVQPPTPSAAPGVPNTPSAPNINIPSFAPVAPKVDPPTLPTPPTFAVILGADCNYGCNSGSLPRQTTKGGFLGSSDNQSKQNIDVFLHYTWPYNSLAEMSYAFKMYKEEDTSVLPAPPTGNNYYFNSYNFGGTKEFANGVANSQGTDRNHQYFFIGGSRFWEIDNAPGTPTYEIPSGRTVNLGGILTLGFVSQENGATLRNSGTITDVDEKNDAYIRAMGSNTYPIIGPNNTTYNIKRSTDGYVGYKVGMAQVEENSRSGWGSWAQFQQQRLENNGTIDFRGERSIGMYIYLPKNSSSYDQWVTYAKLVNTANGKIQISGAESYGMKLAAHSDPSAEMTNNGNITLRKNPNGKDKADKSAAMALMRDNTVTNKVTLTRGKAVNKKDIVLQDNISNALGMFVNIDSDMTNEGTIKVSAVAPKVANQYQFNVAMRADQADLTYEGSNASTEVINKKDIKLTGQGAMGMIASGTSTSGANTKHAIATNNAGATINIDKEGTATSKDNFGMLATNQAEVVNKGTIKIGTSRGSVGMAAMKQGTTHSIAKNEGTISVNGPGATGVYNTGHFSMDTKTASINVKGSQSIGLYAKGVDATHTKTELKQGTIKSEDGGVALYSDQSDVTLNNTSGNLKLVAGKGGLLFYNYKSANPQQYDGKFTIVGPVTADIEAGGYGFYLKNATINSVNGQVQGVPNFLNAMFNTTSNKLKVKMKAGGTFMVLHKPTGGTMKLSSVNSLSSINSALGSKVELEAPATGSYKVYSVYRGKLEINQNVNLDKDDTTATPDAFYKVDFRSSTMLLDAGKTVSGTKSGQVALFQGNFNEGTGGDVGKVGDVSIINNGTIKLTGNSITTGPAANRKTTTAMAGDFITLTNNKNIEVSGNNGIGIYGAGGSKILNSKGATVTVGQEGVALYGANRLNRSTLGDRTISVTNAGTLKGINGKTKAFGIFAENTLAVNKSVLTNSGTIDFTNSQQSIGIHSINSTVSNTGKINMGLKGVAINAKNSNITSSGDITLAGNGIAFNFSGAFTGRTLNLTSKVTLNGNGNSIFNLKDMTFSSSGSSLNENLNIVSNNKSFSYFSMDNSVLTYNKNKTFAGNKVTLVSAKNSTVDWRANLTLSGQESVAFYLNGRKAGTAPELKTAAGKTITLTGNKSVGAYGVNGARIENNSNITVGANGAAIYSTGAAGTLKNTGILTLGKNSVGMYMKDGASLSHTGQINSTQEGAKGLVVNRGTATTYTNNGKINLTGTSSIGIHAEGAAHTINNRNSITVGNTTGKDQSVAIHLKNGGTVRNFNAIKAGNKSIGIYGTTALASLESNSSLTVGDGAIGIYAKGGNVNLNANSKLTIGKTLGTNQEAVGVYYVGNGGTVNNNLTSFTIGKGSIGIVDAGRGNSTINNNLASVALPGDAVYTYTSNANSNVVGNTKITSSGNGNYGYYVAGNLTNNAGASMNFASGTGNVGIYSAYRAGGTGIARNAATITVGKTDLENELYSIGMAAGYTNTKNTTQNRVGHVINTGTINVGFDNSIGMYASGVGSIAENIGTINITGKKAIGMYLESGATGINRGNITIEATAQNAIAAYSTGKNTVFKNYGTITLKAPNSKGIVTANGAKDNVVEGTIVAQNGSAEKTKNIEGTAGGDKKFGDKTLSVPKGGLRNSTITDANGKVLTPAEIDVTTGTNLSVTDPSKAAKNMKVSQEHKDFGSVSRIGMYVDTSGVNFTNPIQGLQHLRGLQKADLIIGTEAAEYTNAKTIAVGPNILRRYNNAIDASGLEKFDVISGSLTWAAVPRRLYGTGKIQSVVMTKVDYKEYAKNSTTPYNFLDGLEQRYDMNALDSKEKRVFNKLNGIGKNEAILLSQAFDEMLGQQYANVQQRVQATGDILDKEFNYLRDEWRTASKDSNKIKTFGTRGEYKTETAGIKDYKYNAYGVAYVHENEDIKLGRGTGWYTGIVHNTFKFKDIGNSKEEMLQAKVGLLKSVPFDENNSLNWTISGDIFVGHNRMNRKFLVVNEVFHAKSKYYTYGIGVKNEISKEFRLSEGFSVRPYAALKLEYGRTSKIREKNGEVRLEVKQNDYFSVRPELGAELAFKHYFGMKALTTSVGVAYENELGRVANAKNKARVGYTSAGWYDLRGEKEDRRGNVKFDFNVGVDNTRVGVTANVGYDTKGENLRGGLGLRVIF
ncbi:autotransporter-associated N-terminal domain-containing protein [Fusobacterium polymorphum]|uniref:autotransporter-associated N-terminal domain-containing protein n=2 Tax=Fusobacterium nucleatum subsp. polymorphum TaxID=76857 RepID=UPI002B4C1038|nr:autotransporter-associated N-terminal domain-containing protein [Fusobacterium polymorphum]WRL71890.1 autotransporter-associated N-terminal domain-containing protein [Fusobacterium polymorphum]